MLDAFVSGNDNICKEADVKKFVSVILGSKSDFEAMEGCVKTLKRFDVPYELIVASAHRSPKRVSAYVQSSGAAAYICAAGMAAHLAGTVKALTIKPVIGVPIASGALNGIDALYSTVQMPSKAPVATVAVGGAVNAAYLAIEILALNDVVLAQKLLDERVLTEKEVESDSASIETLLRGGE